jgi:hypothetical protein
MNSTEPDRPPLIHRKVPVWIVCVLGTVGLAFVLLLLLAVAATTALPGVVWALAGGWLRHGLRVLPDFFAQWRSAGLPLAALVAAGWTSHRLLRWWLAARGSALAETWNMGRSAAVTGMLLLCGASAVAISGVAHQAMWLAQTEWSQTNRKFKLIGTLQDTRDLFLFLIIFESDHGRMPNSWEEFLHWSVGLENSGMLRWLSHGKVPPVLTHPGAAIRGMHPATILMISDAVDGKHVLGLADGAAEAVTPAQLEAILASGGMRYRNDP